MTITPIKHRVIFHYNNDLANEHEDVDPEEMTYHEHLMEEDGKPCTVYIEPEFYPGQSVKRAFEAYFDDGNELNIWLEEMEEIL